MSQVLDAWSMAIGVAWAWWGAEGHPTLRDDEDTGRIDGVMKTRVASTWWGAEGHPTLRLHKDSYPMAAGTEIRLEGWPKAI